MAAAPNVIDLIGVELVRLARLVTNNGDAIELLLERQAVVGAGAGQDEGERDAGPIGDQVAFRTQLAPVGRVWPGFLAPLVAARGVLSRQVQLQSIRSTARSLRSS